MNASDFANEPPQEPPSGDAAVEYMHMGSLVCPDDGPSVLPILPLVGAAEPQVVSVTHCPVRGGCTTTMVRIWAEKDHPTCDHLCGDGPCTFVKGHGVCTVVVPYRVPAESGAGFRQP